MLRLILISLCLLVALSIPSCVPRVISTMSPKVNLPEPISTATSLLNTLISTEPGETPIPKPSITLKPMTTTTQKPSHTLTPTITASPTPNLPGMVGYQQTPTFDASLIRAATPGPTLLCPVINPNLPLPSWLEDIKNGEFQNSELPILISYLNSGGDPVALQLNAPDQISLQDLTSDEQKELLLETSDLVILGCDPGGSRQYKILREFSDEIEMYIPPKILAIQDLNRDGIPELLLDTRGFFGFSTTRFLKGFSWNGKSFSSIIGPPPPYPYRTIAKITAKNDDIYGILYEPGNIELEDVDHNGTLEIIVHSGFPGHPESLANGPWRKGSDTLSWNGKVFVPVYSDIDPPIYRFQAVEDADQAVLMGNFDQALGLYQDTIFSDKLAGWSQALFVQQRKKYMDPQGGELPALYPSMVEEYNDLAAYAYFRILVLHALRGYLPEAQIVYDTLIRKFPEGHPGHISAIMGVAFWKEFQDSQNINQACTQAVNAIIDRQDGIFSWINSFIQGYQSPTYKLSDLCPYGQ